jgi:hypothetical protein
MSGRIASKPVSPARVTVHAPGEQRWSGLLGNAGFDGIRDVREDTAFLKPARLDHGEHPFHEETALHALSTERQLAPDDRVAE